MLSNTVRFLSRQVTQLKQFSGLAFALPATTAMSSKIPSTSTTVASPTSPTASRHFKRTRSSKATSEDQGDDQSSSVSTPPPKKKKSTPSPSASSSSTSTPSKSKPKKSPKKKSPTKLPAKPLPIPDDYEELYALVEELRADKTAPVDSDGAEALTNTKDPVTFRYQTLIALMLSSQTKDAMVGQAMRKMQAHEGGLTIDNISGMSEETLKGLIYGVGFHNNKTTYIKKATDVCKELGDIPNTSEGLCDLPGVGPKMAHIVMSIAWNEVSGIGVDTHMHRIFNILKWVKSNNPEQTRVQLESWLPRDRWDKINLLWVGFGQETQQQKEKSLKKALACSNPKAALKLMKRIGLDYHSEGKRYGLDEEIKAALKQE
ncbi:hypothetical protein TrVE_jg2727 [Triparma verrucosa]|uniref:HhH-GPD domain-containing protein n=1 Tax=Triparma verrucosa TaxID=1606542 RepID=A0A9W7FNE6_9STRA|nr:hypothetical protein TrVE_jg2727 [Triparma verrucosa]